MRVVFVYMVYIMCVVAFDVKHCMKFHTSVIHSTRCALDYASMLKFYPPSLSLAIPTYT